MKHKQGFTLVELLIAAAIIAALAVLATQSFRASSSDVRVEDAKVRARMVAMAVQRYLVDYPEAGETSKLVALKGTSLGTISAPNSAACMGNTGVNSLQNLVNCGYLEHQQVVGSFKRAGETASENFKFVFGADGKVCFYAKNAKIVTTYSSKNSCYCTDGFSEENGVGCE